jgi:beta-glucanase (GH16 family)
MNKSRPKQYSHHPVALACGVLAAIGGSTASAQSAPAPGYTLIWSDEFNGSSLDRGLWCTRLAHGGGADLEYNDPECTGPGGKNGTGDFLKDERQRYRDHNARGEALHVVSDGYLALRATETASDDYASFESALVRSKLELRPSDSESYYITSRLRLPNVQGSFAALWMTAGYGDDGHFDWPPEIDILEAALNGVEDTDSMVRVGVAVKGAQTDSGKEEITAQGPHFSDKWNNFKADSSLRAVWLDVAHEWTAKGVCTYLNGELVQCGNYRWLTNAGEVAHRANVLLNLAVGGDWAGRHGVDGSTPMQMDIDYLRVFKKNGDVSEAPKPSTPVSSIEPPTGASTAPAPPADGSAASPDAPWYESWYFWR